LAGALIALSIAGCGSSSSGGTTSSTSSTTTAGGGGGGAGGAPACFDYAGWKGDSPATAFKADVLPLFRRSCGLSSSCHGSEQAPPGQPYLGPPLSAGDPTPAQIQAIRAAIIDVAAAKEPEMKIVAPGAPAESFLLYKLDGADCAKLACAASQSCGLQMPSGSALPTSERDVVRRWVAQGAKDD
jgi:hypothetical protein